MKHFCLLAGGLLLSGAARSQTLENGGFETPQPGPRQLPAGWAIAPAPGYSIALDSTTAPAGRRSLRLASTADNPPGFQPFRQSVAVQVAHPTILHLRASIKTQEADNVALLCQYWDDTKMVGLTNSLMQGALPTGTGEWRTLDIALLVLPAMRRVVVGGFYVGRGQAWFDEVRLGSPVQYPAGPPAALVRDYIGEVVDIARTHSLVRDSVDWPQLQSELLAMAHGMKTPADSHPIFSYLISVLRQYGDQHSRFNGPAAVSARHAPATAAHATALEEPGARYLGQGLAYVAVPGFGSVNTERQVKFASQLQILISQLDTEHQITGWVVDLRGNGGGNMYPMLAGLGPLVGTGTLGYFLTAGQPPEPFAYRAGEAYANQPGHGTRVPQPSACAGRAARWRCSWVRARPAAAK